MEILKKDILKEMEEKSQENLDKGIDIAVSILKHEFPFVTGWEYKDNPHASRYTVYINLICDLYKASEFYNSPIKEYYKNNVETEAPYPFFPLKLSDEIDNDEKYRLYSIMQKTFTEIYDEIPDEYRHLITDYISTDVVTPKEIYLDGFNFPSRNKLDENINEQFDIDYYETKYNPPKEESDEEVKNLTKNDLLEYGKRYFSKKFFRLFSPKKWRHAVNNRWLEDICNELHWDECGGDNKKIYGFFFEKDGQKYVYVGITNNITSRFRTHLDIKKTRLSKFQKAVEELEIDPKDIDFSVLFPFFLPPSSAAQIEINLIKYFIEDPNYICLNAATGGQLGSRGSSKYIIDNSAKLIKIQKIKDEEEFMKLYPKEYNYLKKTRRLKYVNNLLDKRFFKQGQYTEKDLEQIAKQYPTRGKLRMIDVNAYEAIRNRGLLDKFFPRNINENINDEVKQNISVINLILNEINWEGLCDIWVEYNDEDGDYEIRSKSTISSDEIVEELGYLENTLRSMGIRPYIFTPWYVDDCEDEAKFLNEDYSPAGKEITPNSIIVHKSNPMFRDKIMEEGLKVRDGECYKTYVGYGIKCIPAIFATNSTNKRAWFDSLYDDDIWFIDTRMIPDVKWYKDKHFESTKKHIVTFQNIPKEAITLKYEGTGTSEDVLKSWPKDSPNLYESKDKSTKELIIAVLNTLVLPQYEHVICGFEYKEEKRFAGKNGKTINSPSVTVTFIGGYGTRMWPRTQAVQKMYDDLLDEVWDTVWDYTGISVELYSKYVKECGKTNILE